MRSIGLLQCVNCGGTWLMSSFGEEQKRLLPKTFQIPRSSASLPFVSPVSHLTSPRQSALIPVHSTLPTGFGEELGYSVLSVSVEQQSFPSIFFFQGFSRVHRMTPPTKLFPFSSLSSQKQLERALGRAHTFAYHKIGH